MRAVVLPLDLSMVALTVGAITVHFDPRCDCPQVFQGVKPARAAVPVAARVAQGVFGAVDRPVQRVGC